jgi:hypothetical protein
LETNQLNLLVLSKFRQREYFLNAERERLAREAQRSRRSSKRSFKYRFGQQLANLGRKLADEPETVPGETQS